MTAQDSAESAVRTVAAPVKSDANIIATAKGGGILFAGRIFTFGSRFVISLVLARLLDTQNYGVYSLALSAATITATLALIGLDAALVRHIALWRNRNDEAGVWGSLQVGLGLTFALSLLAAWGLFALSYWIAENIFHDPQLAPYLQISAAIVPFLTLSNTLAGATRGFKDMRSVVIAQNLIQPLVRLVLIVGFILVGLDAYRAIVIFGLADLSASIVLFYYLNKQFSLRRPLSSGRREVKALLSFSLPVWLSESILTFRSSIQTILLGSFATIATAGIFSVASSLNLVADMVQSSVTTAVKPIIVEVHDRGQLQELKRLYQTTSKWMFAFNLPVFLIIVLFPDQLLALFGKGFTDGATALVIMAWASLVDAATGMCGAVLDYTGYPKLKLVNSIVRVALALGLSLWLIPQWGMIGAAVAVLVGEIVVNGMRLIEVYWLLRILPYNLSSLGPLAAGIAALLVTLGVGLLMSNVIPLIKTIVQGTVLIAVYFALLGRLALADEDRAVLAHLRRRAGKRIGRLIPRAS